MLIDTPNLIQWTDPADAAFTILGIAKDTNDTTLNSFGTAIRLLKPVDLSVWLTAQRPALDASGHVIGFASDTRQMEIWDGVQWSQVLTSINNGLGYTPLNAASNLSDLTNVPSALTNLGAAPSVSPALTGAPTAPTPLSSDNSTKLATTAYVQAVVAGVSGGLTYKGNWNATTNTPTLTSGVGTKGDLYIASVAGTTSLDGNASWSVGDEAIFNGTAWQRIPNTSAVSSVFGRTGVVTLLSSDVTGALGYTPLSPAGGTMTGALAMGANLLSGSNFSFSGGTLSGTIAGNATFSGVPKFNSGLTIAALSTVAAQINGGGTGATYTNNGTNGITTITSNGTGNVVIQAPTTAAGSGAIRVNGTLTQKQNPTLKTGVGLGIGGLSPAAIWQDLVWSGVLDTGDSAYNFFRTNDAVSVAAALQSQQITRFTHNLNTGFDGGRLSFQVETNKTAASISGNSAIVGLAVFSHFDAGEGGTAGNYKGQYWATNFDARLNSGDYAGQINVQENDLRLYAGSHAASKINLKLHFGVFDAVHGDFDDTALAITRSPSIAPGTGGGTIAIQFGQSNQDWPLDPTLTNSALMAVKFNTFANLSYAWQPKVGFGIDLSPVYIGQYAWRSTGLWIDGVGQIPILGPGAITYSGTGLKLAAPNVVTQSAAVVAGGTLYLAGDILSGPTGALWTVASVSVGGVVTGLTMLRAGYAAAAPAAGSALLGGRGSGCTATITCAATGTLTLGDTGQTVALQGALTLLSLTNAASDGAAATAGVVVGQMYRNGSALMVRVV